MADPRRFATSRRTYQSGRSSRRASPRACRSDPVPTLPPGRSPRSVDDEARRSAHAELAANRVAPQRRLDVVGRGALTSARPGRPAASRPRRPRRAAQSVARRPTRRDTAARSQRSTTHTRIVARCGSGTRSESAPARPTARPVVEIARHPRLFRGVHRDSGTSAVPMSRNSAPSSILPARASHRRVHTRRRSRPTRVRERVAKSWKNCTPAARSVSAMRERIGNAGSRPVSIWVPPTARASTASRSWPHTRTSP